MPNNARRDRQRRAQQHKLALRRSAELLNEAEHGNIDGPTYPPEPQQQAATATASLNNWTLPRSVIGDNPPHAEAVLEIARRFVRGRGETVESEFILRRNDCHQFERCVRNNSPIDPKAVPGIVGALIATIDRGHQSRHQAAYEALRAFLEAGFLDSVQS